ncbi:MAG: hypothetical protein ACETVT_01715 [bacterium]
MILVVACILAFSTLALAAAKTKVAIVKGTPHDLIGDSFKFSMLDFRKRWESRAGRQKTRRQLRIWCARQSTLLVGFRM